MWTGVNAGVCTPVHGCGGANRADPDAWCVPWYNPWSETGVPLRSFWAFPCVPLRSAAAGLASDRGVSVDTCHVAGGGAGSTLSLWLGVSLTRNSPTTLRCAS